MVEGVFPSLPCGTRGTILFLNASNDAGDATEHLLLVFDGLTVFVLAELPLGQHPRSKVWTIYMLNRLILFIHFGYSSGSLLVLRVNEAQPGLLSPSR